MGRGDWRYPTPPRLALGATSGLGCRQSPGHPAAHTPAVPRRGMGINRKPSAPAVPRDRPGMCRWPPDCLFGVKAAGSCREEPGSTRPGIARELIATSRRDLQHLWVCRDAQLWVPLARDSHPSPLPWPGSGHVLKPLLRYESLAGPRTEATENPGEGQGWGQRWSP